MAQFDILRHVPRLSRRRWLSFTGLGGGAALAARAIASESPGDDAPIAAAPTFGRGKRCLLLFLTGGPPQHDTWDPKPDAPDAIRGELSAIPTTAPGIFVGELFPKLAALAHRYRLVRSLTHSDTVHTTAGYAMLTGAMHPQANDVASATMIRPSAGDRPHVASVLHKLRGEEAGCLPPFALPEIIKDAAVNEFPGLNSGFLSKRYEPVLIEADAERTGFRPPPIALPAEVSLQRLQSRLLLRTHLDRPAIHGESATAAEHFQSALELVQSERLRRAFRIDEEPASVRDAYGTHLFGQGTLLARRLLEADARFVTVYWHYEGPDDSPVWDTHGDNAKHMRERLAPPTDQAVSALLTDLAERGLLDETLVLCLGEFGRSPQINAQAGRDHWPHVASALVAGAGVPGGTVVGASDAAGGYPLETAISPEDWGTTLLHWLGVAVDQDIHDQFGRPHRVSLGSVRPELFG